MLAHRFRPPLFAAIALLLAGCGSSPTDAPAARPVMVVQPQPASATATVFPGEVRARYEPALGFRISGKISRRLVDVGDHVEKGALLAELDPEDAQLQVSALRAQLAAAQADLELAKSERDRHQQLLQRQLISASLFETRDSQFLAAKARADQARAQLNVARNQADYAELRATDAGVIAQRLAEAGQVVAAGQTVFVIAADGEREVAINLPEQGVDRFEIGQPVAIGLWSDPNRRMLGKVREIAPSADSLSRTYAARIALADDAQGVDLGQSARVFFSREGQDALALPLPAVSADGGRQFVWVVDPAGSTVSRREVTIGAFGDDSVPILSGLERDDWVVAAGGHLLVAGQSVLPVDRENRSVDLAASN